MPNNLLISKIFFGINQCLGVRTLFTGSSKKAWLPAPWSHFYKFLLLANSDISISFHTSIYIYETCNGTTLLSTPFFFFVCLEIFVFKTSFNSDVNYQLDLFQHLNWQLYLKHLFCFLHPYLLFHGRTSLLSTLSLNIPISFFPLPLISPKVCLQYFFFSTYGLRSTTVTIGSRLKQSIKQQFLTSGNIMINMLHSKSLK